MTQTKKTRRRFTAEQKCRLLEEAEQPGQSMSSVAREHNIAPSQLFKWKRERENGALAGVAAGEQVVPLSALKEAQKQIKELERMLGKKTVEVEILREAKEIAIEKKWIARTSSSIKKDGP